MLNNQKVQKAIVRIWLGLDLITAYASLTDCNYNFFFVMVLLHNNVIIFHIIVISFLGYHHVPIWQ